MSALRRFALLLGLMLPAWAHALADRAAPPLCGMPTALPMGAGRWITLAVTPYPELDGPEAPEISVDVYIPDVFASGRRYPLVVLLPAPGRPLDMFRSELNIEPMADRAQTIVVLPRLLGSVYERVNFAFRGGAAGLVPGAQWVGARLLPWARRTLPVRTDRAHTAVVGYGTAARGALTVAQSFAEFGLAGAVMGTYRLDALRPQDPDYRLHMEQLGPPGPRWTAADVTRPARLRALRQTQLFVAHGGRDHVAPITHYTQLANALREQQLPFDGCIDPAAGHDLPFVARALASFFDWTAASMGAGAVVADRSAPVLAPLPERPSPAAMATYAAAAQDVSMLQRSGTRPGRVKAEPARRRGGRGAGQPTKRKR